MSSIQPEDVDELGLGGSNLLDVPPGKVLQSTVRIPLAPLVHGDNVVKVDPLMQRFSNLKDKPNSRQFHSI